jgi:hypothetical protein
MTEGTAEITSVGYLPGAVEQIFGKISGSKAQYFSVTIHSIQ